MPLTHEFQCEIGDGFSLRMAHVKKDTHWYCDTQCYIFSNVKVNMDRLRTCSETKNIPKSAMGVPYTRIRMQMW